MTPTNLSTKQNHGRRRQACGCQGARGWGRNEREFGVSRCKLLHLEWIHKILLESTDFVQNPVINHHGKEYF